MYQLDKKDIEVIIVDPIDPSYIPETMVEDESDQNSKESSIDSYFEIFSDSSEDEEGTK